MVMVLAWLGALLGSFAGAQVWRLRARQLEQDARTGEKVSQRELMQLRGLIRPVSHDRSECLHCHHVLAWYDLVPIISWLSLGGRCRYCHKTIGWSELLLELGLAAVFVISYLTWPTPLGEPFSLVAFTLWLIACTLMAILFVYDARWYLLPFSINLALIVVATVYAILMAYIGHWQLSEFLSLGLALVVLAGLYYVFALFGWVGLGDSILGVGLALLLGKWELAVLALFLANLLGCLMLIPLYIQGKLRRSMYIPFGPFLILGTLIAFWWGELLIRFIFGTMSLSITSIML